MCNTAQAFNNDDDSTCFLDESAPFASGLIKKSNKGWSLGRFVLPFTSTFDIYAGAAGCDLDTGQVAGTVTMEYADGGAATVSYSYQIFDESCGEFTETHLYVGCEPLPTAKQGRYTAAPGQFPIVNVHSEGVTSAKYTVTDLECEGGIYVCSSPCRVLRDMWRVTLEVTFLENR